MSPRTWIPVVVAAVVTGTAGYQVGRHRVPPYVSVVPGKAAGTPVKGFPALPTRPIPSRTNLSAVAVTGSLEARLKAVMRDHPSRRWIRLSDLARSVPAAESVAAIGTGNAVLPAGLRDNFRFQVLERWAETDPMAVLEYGQGLHDRNERNQALRPAVIEWARRDANAALEWVQKLPPGSERRDLMFGAIHGLAEVDPAGAMSRIDTLPSQQRIEARRAVLMSIAEVDPLRAAQMATEMGSKSRGGRGGANNLLAGVIQTWAQRDPAAAVEWCRKLPMGSSTQRMLVETSQTVAWQDPQTALELARMLPAGKPRENAFGNALTALTQRDPEGARALLAGLPEGAERNNATLAVAQGMTSDPTAAAEMLKGIRNPGERSWAFHNVGSELAQQDPKAALAWARELPPGQGRDQAMAGVYTGWAQADPGPQPRHRWRCRQGKRAIRPWPRSSNSGRARTAPRPSSG